MGRYPVGEREKRLGWVIRKLREKKGFTQEAFAEHLGIDRSYQGRIERGEASLTYHKITLIAKGLGLSDWELLKKVGEEG